MSKTSTELQLPFAAADVAREVMHWLGYLAAERRMSPKTVEAYAARRRASSSASCREHLGHRRHPRRRSPRLAPQDVRAFMAARRGDGIGGRSLMRMLAGARSFARFLERNGKGKVGALAAVRAPKIGQDAAEAARGRRPPSASPRPICAPARNASHGSLLARSAALTYLLYGSGLRISEALGSLPPPSFPAPGPPTACCASPARAVKLPGFRPCCPRSQPSPNIASSARTISTPKGGCSAARAAGR